MRTCLTRHSAVAAVLLYGILQIIWITLIDPSKHMIFTGLITCAVASLAITEILRRSATRKQR